MYNVHTKTVYLFIFIQTFNMKIILKMINVKFKMHTIMAKKGQIHVIKSLKLFILK